MRSKVCEKGWDAQLRKGRHWARRRGGETEMKGDRGSKGEKTEKASGAGQGKE